MEHILFPGLKPYHIKKMLFDAQYNISDTQANIISKRIFLLTMGVPRLIVYAINFMDNNLKHKRKDPSEAVIDSYWSEFKDYILDIKGHNEILSFSSLLEKQRTPYLELLKFSLLDIPVNPLKTFPPADWGIDQSRAGANFREVTFLEIAWALGSYLQSSPPLKPAVKLPEIILPITKTFSTTESKEAYVVFPIVVVQHILKNLSSKEFDQLGLQIPKSARIADYMEQMVTQLIISRIKCSQKFMDDGEKLSKIFPFFRKHIVI